VTRAQWEIRLLKSVVFALSLLPLALLLWKAAIGELSANPIKDITEETGIWTLRFLVVTLCITPLRQITGWQRFARLRISAFHYLYLS
jgi:sulfoxide reductase heme-binding subunit YedZ